MSPENSVKYQGDAEKERVAFWKSDLVVGFKNNGCTERDVQHSHYNSEEFCNGIGDSQALFFVSAFQSLVQFEFYR
jgi:hypothetical protein